MTESETWTIDELVDLTEEVQIGEGEFKGKKLLFQYCELTEGEEPKINLPDDSASEEEKNEAFQRIGVARIRSQINKANKKNPEGATITEENWDKIPSTVRWGISQAILGGGSASFRELDEGST